MSNGGTPNIPWDKLLAQSYQGPPEWLENMLKRRGPGLMRMAIKRERKAYKGAKKFPGRIDKAVGGMIEQQLSDIQRPLAEGMQSRIGNFANRGVLSSSVAADALGDFSSRMAEDTARGAREAQIWGETQKAESVWKKLAASGMMSGNMQGLLSQGRYGSSTNPAGAIGLLMSLFG